MAQHFPELGLPKVIVITGAGLGLGRALAKRFAADGDSVVLLGRTASKVEAAAAELGERAMAVGCDVSSADAVRAAFARIAERHPRIDVLINNAGIFEPSPIAEASDEHILKIIGTNLIGSIF
jgi:NAD(P)-dependent dehydrogenase (short-subunit alcohol dehydrogenase family)